MRKNGEERDVNNKVAERKRKDKREKANRNGETTSYKIHMKNKRIDKEQKGSEETDRILNQQ